MILAAFKGNMLVFSVNLVTKENQYQFHLCVQCRDSSRTFSRPVGVHQKMEVGAALFLLCQKLKLYLTTK